MLRSCSCERRKSEKNNEKKQKQKYIYIYISVFAFFRYLPLDLSFENFIAISNLKVIPELEKNVTNEQCCQSLSTI